MYFEGSEKKAELVVDPSAPSLRALSRDHWIRVAARAQAKIISSVSNSFCDAYLLSESSLFVFDYKVLMITCGRTTLAAAVGEALRFIPPDRVVSFIYERKNESFPQYQRTSFFDDVQILDQHLPGKAFRFGEVDEHHIYLFHLDKAYAAAAQDTTLEILMHGLSERARNIFWNSGEKKNADVLDEIGIKDIFSGFKVDDHLFCPAGYSLNGIKDDQYLTLHVTPEETGSYASFETNRRFNGEMDDKIRKIIEAFSPASFDLVLFDSRDRLCFSITGYELRKNIVQDLSCGYKVSFMSFHGPLSKTAEKAVELPVPRRQARSVINDTDH